VARDRPGNDPLILQYALYMEGAGGHAGRVDAAKKTALPSWVLTPEQFGAAPGADCTDAFRRMLAAVDAGLRADAGGSVPVARHTIWLGEGPYLISKPWMVRTPGRAQGLTIRGLGKRSSEIVWSGTAGDGHAALLTNHDRWMGVRWYDCSFRSTNAGAEFLYSWSSNAGACQDWGFTNCEWRGTWANGIVLDGPKGASNCNSEWQFHGCHVGGSYTGAWLVSGWSADPTQDQFLNFWFTDCKVEFGGGTFLRMRRGGNVVCRGGSYILTAARPGSRFFHMPPTTAGQPGHADSVQNLLLDGVRFEPRAGTVLDSAWKGQQTIRSCTDTAWSYREGNDKQVMYRFRDPGGVLFEGCRLAGVHQYTQSAAPGPGQQIAYRMCARGDNRSARAFYVRDGAHGKDVRISHQNDRDGIT
jgi:hypothetical protein